ncbi:hypothetical protein B0H14DRAFT_3481373 [Mycena olivaceomarginata]|nr:hypothetical protein B0H14DRAFT_3481373 [Mycena olivaceomarginata]
MTPNGNRCPLCRNQLAVKVAAQGEVPGSKFLRSPPSRSTLFLSVPDSGGTPVASIASSALRPHTNHPAPLRNTVPDLHCAEAGPCALGPHQRHRNNMLLGNPVAKRGLKSLTPASDDEVDAAQLALGIHLSSMSNPSCSQPQSSEGPGPSRQPMLSYGPLRLPTSTQQAGHSHEFDMKPLPSPSANNFLRTLSSSPNFPATLPLPDIPAIAPPPTCSVVKKAVTPKPLRITTQLNKDWMGSDNDLPSPSTFHIKKGITRRFVIVYWHKEDKGHTMFIVNATPSWPQWRITDAVGSFAHWAAIDTAYVHQLTPDCVVMLCQHDIDCKNFEDTISTFYPKNNVVHIRKNLPGERAAVRDMYKDTDSDVEIVEPKKHMTEHDNDELSQPRRQRPHFYIKQEEVDMVRGFQLMDNPLLAHLDRQERFKRVFNMLYSASTVSEQHTIYQVAKAVEIKRGVDARWSAAGLWTVWRKQVEAVKQGTRGVTKRGGHTV